MWSASAARRGVPWVALLVLLAACSVTPKPSPTAAGMVGSPSPTAQASGLARFTHDDWSIEYPAAWRYFPISGFVTSFYDVAGYLASTPVDTSQICQTTPNSQSCNERGYDLPPSNVVITVGGGGIPMDDPVAFYDHPSQGTPARVGGMAAVLEEDQLAADRIVLTWKIARPTAFGNWVQLDADIRGPGEEALRSQVEALIASFHFTPEPTPISNDPAVARPVARKALTQLKTDSAYACFPDEAGVSRTATITSLPFGPSLTSPQPVTCSVTIAPTNIGFWKLDLDITWDTDRTRKAGANQTVEWLAPEGSLGASSNSGDAPSG
ncbi:MAG: hypothetical protein ACXWMN_08350 [Candidatus Limnocylindria bacterium]